MHPSTRSLYSSFQYQNIFSRGCWYASEHLEMSVLVFTNKALAVHHFAKQQQPFWRHKLLCGPQKMASVARQNDALITQSALRGSQQYTQVECCCESSHHKNQLVWFSWIITTLPLLLHLAGQPDTGTVQGQSKYRAQPFQVNIQNQKPSNDMLLN